MDLTKIVLKGYRIQETLLLGNKTEPPLMFFGFRDPDSQFFLWRGSVVIVIYLVLPYGRFPKEQLQMYSAPFTVLLGP